MPGLDGTGLLFKDFVESLPSYLDPEICVYPQNSALGYEELFALAHEMCPQNEEYVVLGESFSGPIAIDIAANARNRPRAMILVNTFVSSPRVRLTKILSYLPGWLLSNPPSLILNFILRKKEAGVDDIYDVQQVIRSLSPGLVKSRLRQVDKVSVVDRAVRVRTPVCVIQAVNDIAISSKATESLLNCFENVTKHEVAGNHFSLQTHPTTTAMIIGEFMKKVLPKIVNDV